MATRAMSQGRARVAQVRCPHPWGAVRRTIGSVVCSECGERFKGDSAIGLVLQVADDAISSAYERIENLENIVAERLNLTTCQICGHWFTKSTARGICLKVGGGDVHLCAADMLNWFEDQDFGDDDQLANVEVQMARWFLRHGEHVEDGMDTRELFAIDRMRGLIRPTIELQAIRLT